MESFKSELALKLEILKSRFSAERKAYDELYAAAISYYYTLSSLEIGEWNTVAAHSAERAMIAASRYTIAVPIEHKNAWLQIWQKARVIVEQAQQIRQRKKRADLWRLHCSEFGKLQFNFEDIAKLKHNSLVPTDSEGTAS